MAIPRVKICGITRLDDARYCASAGADFLGFVQFPESPRYIAPARASEIISWIRGPATVGVFVNEDAATINRVCEAAGFDYAQLHGDESPETCIAVERPVIKAFRLSTQTSAGLQEQIAAYRGAAAYALLDTYVPDIHGGTGRTFDWRIASTLQTEIPLFLAGGLGPENIAPALSHVSPFGIDVSSGLEEAPGVKDYRKITKLFDALANMNG